MSDPISGNPPTRAMKDSPYSDRDRLDALAEAISHIVVYETSARGEKFKIEFRSNVVKGKKKHGCNPEFLRMIANGLLNAPLRNADVR